MDKVRLAPAACLPPPAAATRCPLPAACRACRLPCCARRPPAAARCDAPGLHHAPTRHSLPNACHLPHRCHRCTPAMPMTSAALGSGSSTRSSVRERTCSAPRKQPPMHRCGQHGSGGTPTGAKHGSCRTLRGGCCRQCHHQALASGCGPTTTLSTVTGATALSPHALKSSCFTTPTCGCALAAAARKVLRAGRTTNELAAACGRVRRWLAAAGSSVQPSSVVAAAGSGTRPLAATQDHRQQRRGTAARQTAADSRV
jgi:hypothetical protein